MLQADAAQQCYQTVIYRMIKTQACPVLGKEHETRNQNAIPHQKMNCSNIIVRLMANFWVCVK